jgi:hypothetical protein
MSRRRKNAGREAPEASRVCGFRLDELADQKLRELAERHGTSPNQYAKGVLTTHLRSTGTAPAAPATTQGLDEFGTFVGQVRDEVLGAIEGLEKRFDAVAARLNALANHLMALTEQVGQVDERLAEFLARVEPM